MSERILLPSRRSARAKTLVTAIEREGSTYYAVLNLHPAVNDPEDIGRFAIGAQELGITRYLVAEPQAANPAQDAALVQAGYKRLYISGPGITSPETAEIAFFDLLRQYEERNGENEDRRRLCWIRGKLSLPFLAATGIPLKFDGWQRRVFDMMGRVDRYSPLLSRTQLTEYTASDENGTPLDDNIGIRAITLYNAMGSDPQWLDITCVDRALQDDIDGKQLKYSVTLATPHSRWFTPNNVELRHYFIHSANGRILTMEDDAIAMHHAEYKRLYCALEKMIVR